MADTVPIAWSCACGKSPKVEVDPTTREVRLVCVTCGHQGPFVQQKKYLTQLACLVAAIVAWNKERRLS